MIAHVCADPDNGADNHKLVQNWLEKWTAKTEQAAQALKGIFELKGIAAEPFASCLERARAHQRGALRKIGF